MSQGFKLNSKKPSKRPAATLHKSKAAEPSRRAPAVLPKKSFKMAKYWSIIDWSTTGKPVPIKHSFMSLRLETRMRRSLSNAPLPLEAVNNSLRSGAKTKASSTKPLCKNAMEMAYWP